MNLKLDFSCKQISITFKSSHNTAEADKHQINHFVFLSIEILKPFTICFIGSDDFFFFFNRFSKVADRSNGLTEQVTATRKHFKAYGFRRMVTVCYLRNGWNSIRKANSVFYCCVNVETLNCLRISKQTNNTSDIPEIIYLALVNLKKEASKLKPSIQTFWSSESHFIKIVINFLPAQTDFWYLALHWPLVKQERAKTTICCVFLPCRDFFRSLFTANTESYKKYRIKTEMASFPYYFGSIKPAIKMQICDCCNPTNLL